MDRKPSYEKWYCVVIILIVLWGVFDEILLRKGLSLFFVRHFETVSLSLIQVEAVLLGLTISIIALLTGKIDNSFLGIGYTDYLLNIKPIVFKQKWIILSLLLLIVLSFTAHMINCYNLVCSFFLCSCMLIWISTSNTLIIFSGTNQLKDEISAYFILKMTGDESDRIKLLTDMVKEWKRSVCVQTNNEYEEYDDVFCSLFEKMISADSERSHLRNACVTLTRTLLSDSGSYERGLRFFSQCYKNAASFVLSNRDRARKEKESFLLFSEVCMGMKHALSHMPIIMVEESYAWSRMTEYILIVNLNLGYDQKNNSGIGERRILSQFGGVLGRLISKEPERNAEFWGIPLNQMYSGLEKTEDSDGLGANVITEQKLWFVFAMIEELDDEIIREYMFHRDYKFAEMDIQHALMMLKVFCYLYYLAFYESEDCASKELINFCRKLCDNSAAIQAFSRLINYLEEHDTNISAFPLYQNEQKINVVNGELRKKLIDGLQIFEKFPRTEAAKTILIDDVVTDFVMFLCTYIAYHYNRPELIDQMIKNDMTTYYYCHFIRDCDRLKQLEQWLSLTGFNSEENTEQVKDLYALLVNRIRDQHKKAVLQNSEKKECFNYSKISLIQKGVQDYLEERFRPVLTKSQHEGTEQNVFLLQLSISNDLSLEKEFRKIGDVLFRATVQGMINKLNSMGKIDFFERNADMDNEAMISLIRSWDNKTIVLGSEFALRPLNYHQWEWFKEQLDAVEHSTCGGGKAALVLKKGTVSIYFKEITIKRHSQTIEESKALYNPSSELYSYEPIAGLPIELSEEELKKLLEKTRSVYEISAIIGFVFSNEDAIIGEAVIR